MKRIFSLFILIMLLFSFCAVGQLRQKIGTNATNIEASAVLELASTARGFLPPRMTLVQRNNIDSPEAGLIVWCTNCGPAGELQVYNGSYWTNGIGGIPSLPPCGAYLSDPVSGLLTFKIFACHNLGADETKDPHIPVQEIFGNYYVWGRQFPVGDNIDIFVPWLFLSLDTPWKDTPWKDEPKATSDPCPNGFKVPSKDQWESVLDNNVMTTYGSWSAAATNYVSALHFRPSLEEPITLTLPAAGFRNSDDGSLSNVGSRCQYWSSSNVATDNSQPLYFAGPTQSQQILSSEPTYGRSVCCISE